MTPSAFILEARSAGFALAVRGNVLDVTPASRLSDPQRQFIKRHKPALLALLTGRPEPEPVPRNEPAPDLPVPWDAIRDRIAEGWRATFGPPDEHGFQAIRWTPPGEWAPEPLAPKTEQCPHHGHPLTDAELAALVTEVAYAHGADPVAVWRWLAPEDIQALRSGDPDEARAFRAAVGSAYTGGRLVPDGGHSLPFPRAGTPKRERVMCGRCRHFAPDAIGDPRFGIGRCLALANPPGGPLYPCEDRHCGTFVAREGKP